MILFAILYWGSSYTAGLLTLGIYLVLYFKRKNKRYLNLAIFNINMLFIVFSFFLFIILPDSDVSIVNSVNAMLLFFCSTMIYTLPRWLLDNDSSNFCRGAKRVTFILSMVSIFTTILLALDLFSNRSPFVISIIAVMTSSIAFSMIYSSVEDYVKKRKKQTSVAFVTVTAIFIPCLIILNFFYDRLNIPQEILMYFHVIPGFYILLSIHCLFELKGQFWNKQVNYDSFIASKNITPREREVMELILNGDSYQAISDKLCISLSTVKTHISNLFKKTNTANKVELMALIHQESS